MGRALIAAAAGLALGAAGTGSAAAPAATAASGAVPKLRLVDLTPLTLRGSGFRAQERVRLTLAFRRVRTARTIRSGRAGGFTVRFRTLLALDPCRGTVVVTAVGAASGLRATWKRRCRPPDAWP
jgi:hypothetical protein